MLDTGKGVAARENVAVEPSTTPLGVSLFTYTEHPKVPSTCTQLDKVPLAASKLPAPLIVAAPVAAVTIRYGARGCMMARFGPLLAKTPFGWARARARA